MIGETPAVAWEPWLRPWAEDLAMTGHRFFYYLVAGPGDYCVKNLRLFRTCSVGNLRYRALALLLPNECEISGLAACHHHLAAAGTTAARRRG